MSEVSASVPVDAGRVTVPPAAAAGWRVVVPEDEPGSATLEMPVLILPSVQVNIRAGEMPPKDDNGIAYLKIPVNAL